VPESPTHFALSGGAAKPQLHCDISQRKYIIDGKAKERFMPLEDHPHIRIVDVG
jgi:hypothetical protein